MSDLGDRTRDGWAAIDAGVRALFAQRDALESRLAVLERENAELRAGLKPFAAIAERIANAPGRISVMQALPPLDDFCAALLGAARLLAGEDTK